MSFSGAEGKRKREGEGFGIKYVLIRKVVCVLEDFLLLPNVFNYFQLSDNLVWIINKFPLPEVEGDVSLIS